MRTGADSQVRKGKGRESEKGGGASVLNTTLDCCFLWLAPSPLARYSPFAGLPTIAMTWSPPPGMSTRQCLAEFGVAVVPNVLDLPSIDKYKAGLFDAFEHLTSEWDTPFRRNGTREELRAAPRGMYASHAQLYQYPPSLGHSQAVWNIRQDPRVVQVFADIYGVEPTALLCSYDGVAMLPPPELTGLGWQNGGWLHADTSFINPKPCVQGFVNFFDVQPGDGTLTVLLRSHAQFQHVPSSLNVPDKSFVMLKTVPGLQEWYEEQGCEQVRIQAPAGSMVLWDTKTIHSGSNPLKGRASPNWRLVVYTCMMPRTLSSPKDIQRRISIFERGRMSNHYAAKPQMFAALPRTYGGKLVAVKPLPTPVLTNLGRKLVGYSQ